MFVQHLDRMQLYQQPTGVLLTPLCHQDGDLKLVLSLFRVLEGFLLMKVNKATPRVSGMFPINFL